MKVETIHNSKYIANNEEKYTHETTDRAVA